MSVGPGKYDVFCSQVRQDAYAEAVILIVMNGVLGSGFSVQAPQRMSEMIPQMLRNVAQQIEDALVQSMDS